ncbi:MAG: D-cysteine desulfhydrase family protein [Eubacteriales bacterium]|nr:D-cysteine desulfhydrase family protein [Eubacteriales bacterium]
MRHLNLANLPTPIRKLDLLPDQGVNLWIKRDDYSGVELSGNKIRKLEFSLAECQEQGCDYVITRGAIQSNHCRATAAACAQLGLKCILVLNTDNPPSLDNIEGNTFFDLALGAEVYLVKDKEAATKQISELTEQLKAAGHKPYLIPVGASNAVGSNGYRRCLDEIVEQEKEMGVDFDLIALAVGSGGTYAGLAYENVYRKLGKKILGFAVCDSTEIFTRDILAILEDMTKLEQSKLSFGEGDVWINDDYIGLGYALSRDEELAFIMEIAAKTGVILDPCYSGKAFYGLHTELTQGNLSDYKNVLFIHTGGLAGWTAEARKRASKFVENQWHDQD